MDWNNLFSGTAWKAAGFMGVLGVVVGVSVNDDGPLPLLLGAGLFLATWYWLLSRGAHLVCPYCSEDVKARASVCPHCGRSMYPASAR
jgi:hypothetical protein